MTSYSHNKTYTVPSALHTILGPPVQDAEEETFLLYTQDIPSNNLGMVDAKAETVEIEIGGHDYVLRQSPGLLTSNRAGGTTGAALWKITPLLASWLASLPPLLRDLGALHSESTVVELGCGVAGLLGLVLSRVVGCYVLTDQEYVMKYLKENILMNTAARKSVTRTSNRKGNAQRYQPRDNLSLVPLDWETTDVGILTSTIGPQGSIDLLVLCDCVYNDFLVSPLVQTCIDICRLGTTADKNTIVLIAQQLRADSICELFLATLMKHFDVWRVQDAKISAELRSGSGYVVHLATLKG
ncbi:hypothetical protein KCU88_g6520, partial [Aureobasidium melanogenum]